MKKNAKRVKMDRNYFVTDPRFWALLKDGYVGTIEHTPTIGDSELQICLQKPKHRGSWVNLIGCYVRGIELLPGKPERVLVDTAFASKRLGLILREDCHHEFDGQHSGMAQVHIMNTRNDERLVVYLDYHCEEPDNVHITVDDGSTIRQGHFNVSLLRKMVAEKKVVMTNDGKSTTLSVAPHGSEQYDAWILPDRVLPRHVLSAARELMRFVDCVTGTQPKQKQRGGRNTSPHVLERNAY